ncbi:MAG TPA: ATP-binding cassette domain-containing protein [Clostridiales bacterium]|nr:ATP-binding cassette domain-containing protein [Clostridiales bacterium]
MLTLKDIKKSYRIGEIETKALNGISASFREKEFVAILGTSGSGKTTLLNIIGGLDRYDSGELTFKGRKTSDFSDKDWDAYRNNTIGFVFQSYNLIMHLSIVENVELGMTLSGVSASEKHRRAVEVLKQVGLEDHLHKKPNQLSGGQMQRVAIARALANDPEILLCDEPTGALDTTTSAQIMDLIKELSKDRLVIMVTHNPDIAQKYADRIIRLEDGQIISDSNPYETTQSNENFKLKKTSMSFFTALKLSYNNLKTKKFRTFLTAFASSIGIIGIAVILSLSTGFKRQIDIFQRDTMAEFPIIISQTTAELNPENIETMREKFKENITGTAEYADTHEVYLYDPSENTIMHKNNFTDEFMEYLKNIDPEICSSIGYTRIVNMNALRHTDSGEIKPVSFLNPLNNQNKRNMYDISSMEEAGLSSYPKQLKADDQSYLEKNYEVLYGEYPKSPTDLVLVIDTRNRINKKTLEALGFDTDGRESISFEDIVGTEIKIVPNDNYYVKTELGNFIPNQDFETVYNSEGNITAKIVGVVRKKKSSRIGLLGNGIAYSDELAQLILDTAADSEIVKAQKASNRNVIDMSELDEESKEQFLAYLGGDPKPFMIMIYPENFEDKDAVISYLDKYNEGKNIDDQIVYTDLAGSVADLTSGIMDGITIVLIAFAAISLVVSLIMISIITYISVLERTKEIGILRSLGARKKDITRVFDAETCIIGVFSGLIGIVISYLLTFPINSILYKLTELENVSHLKPTHAIFLIILSTILTILGGHIPARMASKRDPVVALRSE